MPTGLLRRLAAPALLLLFGACESPSRPDPRPEPGPEPQPGPQEPAPVTWLKANARPIRSLDVADRDFSDLQPLKAAMGDARVVMLGEQTHGDGTTFLAKARLVAFLHQEMGFDVLAWESGLWDVREAWRQVQTAADVLPASRRGIFDAWSASEQVLPALDYVASTIATARPIDVVGFDSRITSMWARDSLHVAAERFARQIGSTVPDDPEWPAAAATLRDLAAFRHYANKPSSTDQERLLRLMGDLRSDAAARPGSDRDALFWTQVLSSLSAHARAVWAAPAMEPESGNARDAQMARNVVWLADRFYPGRKIIVWAATLHIARDIEQLRLLSGEQPYLTGFTTPMGGAAFPVLGRGMYTIGFTAGSGYAGRVGAAPSRVAPPVAGSLEAHLAAAGMENAFVDFRSLAPGGEWLRESVARPLGYLFMRGDWTRVLDGMIYTQTMTPSTAASR